MSERTVRGRVAGVTIPLFSVRTERSWGIGEIPDLVDFAQWMTDAGMRLVQLLPLGEIGGGETSPYSALSAFGIDPIYIGWGAVPDLPQGERDALLGDGAEGLRRAAEAATSVDYATVRAVKDRALTAAYRRFRDRELDKDTTRAQAFHAFCQDRAWWLSDYALYRALRDLRGQEPWWRWPDGWRQRDARTLENLWSAHREDVHRHQYAQWIAHSQWSDMRAKLDAMGVEVMGDLPFVVGRDSADVWAHADEFRRDTSVGAPADQFDRDGQEWGLPPYDWSMMRANGFRWLRRRAQYAGSLYHRFRIDHLVGFFRTYQRPVDKLRGVDGRLLPGFFDPADEAAQHRHGQDVLRAMIDAARAEGADLIAEDLGVIPDYVRPTLAALDVPGYKVLIWEQEAGVFRDPAGYPVRSVACFGTHDTDAVRVWWTSRADWEREAVARLPAMAAAGATSLSREFTPAVHRALMSLILGARSELALLLVQDILGTVDRINVPSTVGSHNWSWRLPDTVAALSQRPEVRAVLGMVRAEVERSGRLGAR